MGRSRAERHQRQTADSTRSSQYPHRRAAATHEIPPCRRDRRGRTRSNDPESHDRFRRDLTELRQGYVREGGALAHAANVHLRLHGGQFGWIDVIRRDCQRVGVGRTLGDGFGEGGGGHHALQIATVWPSDHGVIVGGVSDISAGADAVNSRHITKGS